MLRNGGVTRGGSRGGMGEGRESEEKRRDGGGVREWSREGGTKREQGRGEEARKMRAFGSEEVDEQATMRGEEGEGGEESRVRGREGGSWMFERTQFA